MAASDLSGEEEHASRVVVRGSRARGPTVEVSDMSDSETVAPPKTPDGSRDSELRLPSCSLSSERRPPSCSLSSELRPPSGSLASQQSKVSGRLSKWLEAPMRFSRRMSNVGGQLLPGGAALPPAPFFTRANQGITSPCRRQLNMDILFDVDDPDYLHHALWYSARQGDRKGVEWALAEGADVHFVQRTPQSDPIVFKGRNLSACTALHAAAWHSEEGACAPMQGRFSDCTGPNHFFAGAIITVTPTSWKPEATAYPSTPFCSYRRNSLDPFDFQEIRADQTVRHFRFVLQTDGTVQVTLGGFTWVLHPAGEDLLSPDMELQGTGRTTTERDNNESSDIIQLLLEHGASVDAKAEIHCTATDGSVSCREITAMHLVCAVGNVKSIRTLVEHGADIGEWALLDGEPHYQPIHDAVWFNKNKAVACLLELEADLGASNNRGETAVHIAAKCGHSGMMSYLLMRGENATDLLTRENELGEIPLDLAIRDGRFPQRSLHLFTQSLDHIDRALAFLKVATACPLAAAALLRACPPSVDGIADADVSVEDSDTALMAPIDAGWCRSLREGALQGIIGTETLSFLIEKAPRAAMDILDALSMTPEVRSQEHWPLPLLTRVPPGNGPWPVAFAYEQDSAWEWNHKTREHNGGREWHSRLVKVDARRGQEVRIKVVHLPGLACLETISALASTSELRMFTRIPVHALLNFSWSKLRAIYLTHCVHSLLALLVLNRWIFGQDEVSPYWRSLLWSIMTSKGIISLVSVLYMVISARPLSPVSRRRIYSRVLAQLAADLLTLLLCFQVNDELWPDRSDLKMSPILAVNSVLHWCLLLFALRAFRWIGQRLLPIAKSMKPILGMVCILSLVCVGWIHSFWALLPDRVSGESVVDIGYFLYAGEAFIQDSDVENLPPMEKWPMIILILLAQFLFLACALNIFIAVLSDCYDFEQERTVCSFQSERACICTTLLLGPRLVVGNDRRRRLVAGVCGCTLIALWLLTFVMSGLGGRVHLGWCLVSSLVLALSVVAWRAVLLGSVLEDWPSRYLWMCYKREIDDEVSIVDLDQRQKTWGTDGRIAHIKRCVHHESRSRQRDHDAIVRHCNSVLSVISDLQSDLSDKFQRMETAQDRLEKTFESTDETGQEISRLLSQLQGARRSAPLAVKQRASKSQSAGARVLWLQGCTGNCVAINGVYRPMAEEYQNRPCWQSCHDAPYFLFHTGKSRWALSRKLGDTSSCFAYAKDSSSTSRSPSGCAGTWMRCDETGQWVEEPALKCAEQQD